KVYFPRLIVPLSSIGASVIDLLICTAILLLMMVWYHIGWGLHLLAAPVPFVGAVLATIGVGTLLSAVTVAYRDFTHITPFLTQIWLYATPVVFPVSLVPARWRWLLYLNPMTGVVEGFRSAFLNRSFDYEGLAISFAVSALSLIVAIAYF